MTRKNDTSPAAQAAPRGAWTAPRLRRLATSVAAFNGTSPTSDLEGFS